MALRLGRRYGIAGRVERVRQVDVEAASLIVCMDAANMREMVHLCHGGAVPRLMREWGPDGPGDVPNPSGCDRRTWARVACMLERCCLALADDLRPANAN